MMDMASVLHNMLAKKAVRNNFLTTQADNQKAVNTLAQQETAFNALDEVTNDLGDVRAGRFIALTSGDDPTDPNATGVFMSAEGETISNQNVNIGGLSSGALEFGLDATTGKALFAGGSMTMDTDGITVHGTEYSVLHTDLNGSTGYVDTAELTLSPQSGHDDFDINYTELSPSHGNLITNGDAETGNLTGWTATSTKTSWGVTTTNPYEGVYSFQMTVVPTNPLLDEAYNTCIGQLTSNRFAVTAGSYYQAEAYIRMSTPYPSVTVVIEWFTALVGGSSLGTQNVETYLTVPRPWTHVLGTYLAPTGANAATIYFYCLGNYIGGDTQQGSVIAIDAVSVRNPNTFAQIKMSQSGVNIMPSLTVNSSTVLGNKPNDYAVQAQYQLTRPYYMPTVSQIATSTGNCTNGVHSVAFVFEDQYGTTLGSPPATVTVDATHKQISVACLPCTFGSGGDRTTYIRRRVYMTTAGGAIYYYAGTIASNSPTTTLTINISDANLGLADTIPQVNATKSRFTYAGDNMICNFVGSWAAFVEPLCRYNTYWRIISAIGESYKYTFAAQAGLWGVEGSWITSSSGGILDFYVDGALASTKDTYSSASTYNVAWNFAFTLSFDGVHEVIIRASSKNASSAGYRGDVIYIAHYDTSEYKRSTP
jgi:hypothetical protein